ncbi:MAG: hypothetical protein ACFB0E_18840 [Leptolyngbyaceae cyanobacterium]
MSRLAKIEFKRCPRGGQKFLPDTLLIAGTSATAATQIGRSTSSAFLTGLTIVSQSLLYGLALAWKTCSRSMAAFPTNVLSRLQVLKSEIAQRCRRRIALL